MAVEQQERDSYTGYLTTGHEWNGIKELNTPVPRVVYFFLTLAVLFSVGYWILMPAWPLGVTSTKGLLGIDQRNVVAASLKEAAADRSVWTKKIETESFAAIQSDPKSFPRAERIENRLDAASPRVRSCTGMRSGCRARS